MINKNILHYKIVEKLGQGGMGIVYKARDSKLDRDVAIKFLPANIAANREERKRFEIEAKAAAALNHPNIATVFAIEEYKPAPTQPDVELFIVMEYIDGQELRHFLKSKDRSSLQTTEIIDIASQIASGLQAAHAKGIVHRDIKSSNIMITAEGKVKIMDFGLAKIGQGMQLTGDHSTLGTTAYMSPEQARGEEVDQRTDIWSFGVLLYEMLSGSLPFKGDYEQAVMYAIINEEPQDIGKIQDEAAAPLQSVINKALTKDRNQRYQTMEEVLADLKSNAINTTDTIYVKPKKTLFTGLLLTVLLVLILALTYLYETGGSSNKEDIKTLAVLPFVNTSGDKEQEFFSDGLTEELLNVLAKNPKLRVTSRTSVFSFKGKNMDIGAIASKLNVKHILEGSVRKAGKLLRITTTLIDVQTDAQLWSKTYNMKMIDIFAVQESISNSVAKALNLKLLGYKNVVEHRPTNPEAYSAYLRAEHFLKLSTQENLQKAISYYTLALKIDSGYARAWVGLSSAHTNQADMGYASSKESYEMARKELTKALKFDPLLGRAHAGLGWIKQSYDWDWAAAEKAYAKALELDPNDVDIIRESAVLQATLGHFNAAIKMTKHAIKLDPINTANLFNLGLFQFNNGLPAQANASFRKALELNPQDPGSHMKIGLVYATTGKADSALAEMKQETEMLWREYGLAIAYSAIHNKEKADYYLKKVAENYKDDAAFQIAEIYAFRGENDMAFKWLQKAYDQRDPGLAEIKGDPLLRNLVNDKRYTAFLKLMKLPI